MLRSAQVPQENSSWCCRKEEGPRVGGRLCGAEPTPSFSFVKMPEKVHLYQEEPTWLIPSHLQLFQLRQHSHSGETGYLRVILLFESCFVLEPPDSWRVDWHSMQLISIYQISILYRELSYTSSLTPTTQLRMKTKTNQLKTEDKIQKTFIQCLVFTILLIPPSIQHSVSITRARHCA